jgi:acyl dehydratase
MLYYEDIHVGESIVVGPYELTEEEIIAFARRWDPRPFHIDPVAAATTPVKGLIASSAHTFAICALLLNQMKPSAAIAATRHELEMTNPARPDDKLSLRVTYLEKRLSESKPDRGLVIVGSTLTNQTGEIVLKVRSTTLVFRRPSTSA